MQPVSAAVDGFFAGAGEAGHDRVDELFGHESVGAAADHENGPRVLTDDWRLGYAVVPDVDVACHHVR